MQLLTIDDVKGGSAGALLKSGHILHMGRAAQPDCLETWLPTNVKGLLAGGSDGLDVVRRMVARFEAMPNVAREAARGQGILLDSATTRLLAPLPNPSLIVAAGLAYRSHLAEMAATPAPPHPTAFMKSPSSVTSPGAVVSLPPQAPELVDYEGEFVVVFGRHCHNIEPSEAFSYVAGYMAANDLSARDWAKSVWGAKEPWEARITWEVNIMGKQFPGFTPLGPVLTTADEIPDPNALRLTTRLNGNVMQDSLVGDLIFPMAEMIAHFARWYTFEAGDILLMGTPAGVGLGRKPPVLLRAGDELEVSIEKIGSLKTTMG